MTLLTLIKDTVNMNKNNLKKMRNASLAFRKSILTRKSI